MDRKKYWKFMLLMPFIGMVFPPILMGMMLGFIGYIIFSLVSIYAINKLDEKSAKFYILFSPAIAGAFQIFSLAHPIIWLGQPDIGVSGLVELLKLLALATTVSGYFFLLIATIFYWLLKGAGKFNDKWV